MDGSYSARAICVASGDPVDKGVPVGGGLVGLGIAVGVKVGIGVFVGEGVTVKVEVAVAVDVGIGVDVEVEVFVGLGVGVPNRLPSFCASKTRYPMANSRPRTNKKSMIFFIRHAAQNLPVQG